jgi:hypothetical protein
MSTSNECSLWKFPLDLVYASKKLQQATFPHYGNFTFIVIIIGANGRMRKWDEWL